MSWLYLYTKWFSFAFEMRFMGHNFWVVERGFLRRFLSTKGFTLWLTINNCQADWLTNVTRDCLTDLFSDQLTDWFFDFLGVWLIVWHYEWMNDWLINWMIDWFSDWLTYWLADWVTDWLIDDKTSMDQARIGQETKWLTDWLIDWLIYRPCEKSVLTNLLKFTIAMILLPISCFFLSKKIFYEGNHIIFGTKSTEVFLNFPFHSQDFDRVIFPNLTFSPTYFLQFLS